MRYQVLMDLYREIREDIVVEVEATTWDEAERRAAMQVIEDIYEGSGQEHSHQLSVVSIERMEPVAPVATLDGIVETELSVLDEVLPPEESAYNPYRNRGVKIAADEKPTVVNHDPVITPVFMGVGAPVRPAAPVAVVEPATDVAEEPAAEYVPYSSTGLIGDSLAETKSTEEQYVPYGDRSEDEDPDEDWGTDDECEFCEDTECAFHPENQSVQDNVGCPDEEVEVPETPKDTVYVPYNARTSTPDTGDFDGDDWDEDTEDEEWEEEDDNEDVYVPLSSRFREEEPTAAPTGDAVDTEVVEETPRVLSNPQTVRRVVAKCTTLPNGYTPYRQFKEPMGPQ